MANPKDPAPTGEVRSIKVDMGMGPPAGRPTGPPPSRGGASVVLSSLLALLFGCGGAWAYERFLAGRVAPAAPASPGAEGGSPEAHKTVADLEDRVQKLADRCNDLDGQNKQLQARLESMPRSGPAPDLGPIEQKVAQVDRLSQRVEAIGQQVAPLARQLEQSERRIADLDEKLDGLRNQETTARVRTTRGRDRQLTLTRDDRPPAAAPDDRLPAAAAPDDRPAPQERPAPAEEPRSRPAATADEKGESEDLDFASGLELFRKREYGEAYAFFRKLLQDHSEDARVWYYAALSYGLATGDWDRMTQSMADEGSAREKANKPPKPEIDAALAGLTKETGKEWIDYYRRRAR